MRHASFFSVVVLSFLSVGGCADNGQSASSNAPGFVHTDNATLVGGDGSRMFLRGVSFGNEVWTNVAIPDDHGEVDFGRLATMGANSTRFLLNYVTFEDDAAPYVYKQAGWDWIDENLAWARAHGIYLILNMHVPQGGFQSLGAGGALWSDPSNQDRLTALWKAIAARYANEPMIAAYDLLNEPEPLASSQQWASLAARIGPAFKTARAASTGSTTSTTSRPTRAASAHPASRRSLFTSTTLTRTRFTTATAAR